MTQPQLRTPDEIPANLTDLRWMVDSYEQTQRLRIMLGNQLLARESGLDQNPTPSSVRGLYGHLKEAERLMLKDFDAVLTTHPAMRWLREVKGVGPTLAAKLLSHIDIQRANTVSALWRFAGYAVVDGKRERMQAALCPVCGARGSKKAHHCPVDGETRVVKGMRRPYNVRLKTACYLVAGQFLKCGSPYVERVYRPAREYYAANRPDWSNGRQHLAAMRKMSKMFLSHLWLTWREAEGLPIREPYVAERLAHEHIIGPWEMVGRGE